METEKQTSSKGIEVDLSRLDVSQNSPHWGQWRRCTERRRRFPGLAVLERILERVSVTLTEKMRLRGRKQRGRQEVHPRWSPQEDGSHRRFGVRCGKRKLHLRMSISH